MHKERAGYSSWPLVTCSCSYIAGPHIPEAAVSTAVGGQVTTSLCLPQCWCRPTCCGGMYSFRTGMVHPSSQPCSSNGGYLRRIRNLWLRYIFSPSWLVSTRMAKELTPSPYHIEAHSHSSSTLGKPVEVQMHMFQVGQQGSSRHPQSRTSRDQLRT